VVTPWIDPMVFLGRKHRAAIELLYRLGPWPMPLVRIPAPRLYAELERRGFLWMPELSHWVPLIEEQAW
jgi:hypothetical protein